MNIKIAKWFKNISISKKLFFVVGTMALLIALELLTLWFSLNTLSSVRAFVAGEGLWSKAQKDAVFNLQKYSRTYNENDYINFQNYMKVPLGDHKTLVELSKKKPDLFIARQGFLEGGNHPQDIDGMIKLFTRFHDISYIHKAISIWTEADSTITKLIPISQKLNAEITSVSPSFEKVDALISEIDPINQQLTILENDFSYTLGEGARWLENLILTILFLITITVEFTGLFLTITVSIALTKGINEIIRTANGVATGNLNLAAKIYSKDEIGKLATSFNKMIKDLNNNINERAKVEQNLRKQRDLYESLIETQSEMGHGIAITENKTFIYINDALCKMYGYSKDEIEKHPSFMNLVIPEDKKRIETLLKKILAGPETSDKGETTVIRKDGKKINIQYSFKTFKTDGRLQILSVIHDISQRKQAEEALKQKTQELIRSNSELEQFAYMASHDLQEPLRMVTSYVQLLEDRYKDKLDKDANEFIEFAVDGTERMRNLINGLLEYSRVNKVHAFEIINTDELLDEVLQNFSSQLKENNIKIVKNSLPVIIGDNLLISQLFQNLISNAIKFRNNKNPEIIFSGIKVNNAFQFSITDNGIGIEEKYLEKIFVIFQRLHTYENYQGTGIGLAICKKIVEKHGGQIWCKSELNKGSAFYFTIKEKG